MYCSIYQAVFIWDELRDAMEGKAHFDGDTAKIYSYMLMPNHPSGKVCIEDCLKASSSLVSIIEIFCQRHENTEFTIDGMGLASWEELSGASFDHAVKVKCFKK